MDYAAFTVTSVVVLALLATATDILGARAGRLGVSAIIIAGTAAHAYALARAAVPPWGAALLALLMGGIIAAAAAAIVNRVTSDMFLLITLAAQLLVVSTIRNATALGGMIGIGVPGRWTAAGVSTAAVLCCFVALAVTQRVFDSRTVIAAAYAAIAEDEVAARSAALPIAALRQKATMYHGILASLSGVLIALQYRYVAAEMFDFRLSVTVLTAMYIGGPAQPSYRHIYGAGAVVAVEELIAWVMSGSTSIGPLQRIVVNLLLVGILAAHVLRRQRRAKR